jgi:hypothetical protein
VLQPKRRTPRPAGTGAAFKDTEQLRRQLDQIKSIKSRRAQAQCRECGSLFDAKRSTREFCSSACRATFHNRRGQRGAEIFDLAMAWRFDRKRAAKAKALTLLCRALARFRNEDVRARDGRPSCDDVARTRMRRARLHSIVVGI